MIYCFDTSAINRLLDDPDRELILKAILSVGSVWITAYNVLEAAKTKDQQRRRNLIKLMRRLSDGKRPLDPPNTLLLTYANAHAQGASAARVNADGKLEGLWIALKRPDRIDEKARQEVMDWATHWENDFSEVVTGNRDIFQDFFRKAPSELPRTTASTLRAYLDKQDECHSLIGDVCERQTGRTLSISQYQVLVREPVWALYFVGYAYALHHRSIKQCNFS